MKIIKRGRLERNADGAGASFDVPLDDIAEAFGVSTAFFVGAFEAGQVEARAEESEEGTIVITFRMGEPERAVGIAADDEDDDEETDDGVPEGSGPGGNDGRA